MGIRQVLQEWIPDAYYSNGRKSECTLYKICNMFDVDRESFKEVKKEKDMEESKLFWGPESKEPYSVEISNLVLDGHKIGIEDGKVVVKK